MTQQSDSKVMIPQPELESRAIELSTSAFAMFCNDLAGMLGCDIAGAEKGTAVVTLADLEKQFKKLVTVTSVQAAGALNGNFYLFLDQEAFFTLAGTRVMLADKVITQNRKHGTLQTATEMGDAVGEIGNLMVGSWDRVFRKEFAGHGHFALSKNFIGRPWNSPEEAIGLTTASQLQAISYEIRVKEFAPVVCAVVYPKDLFEPKPIEQERQDEINEDTAAEIQLLPAIDESSAGAGPLETTLSPVVQQTGEVAESIRKITSSPATLPGQGSDNIAQALGTAAVQDVMRRDFVWASPEETVEQALAKMQRTNIGYVLVGQNGVLEGVVSKSDIRGAISPYLQKMFARWRRPLDAATLKIRLKWVMSKPVYTIPCDASLIELAQQMSRQKIRMLPAVDTQGCVKGIVTAFEIFSAFSTLS